MKFCWINVFKKKSKVSQAMYYLCVLDLFLFLYFLIQKAYDSCWFLNGNDSFDNKLSAIQ